jgi:hypothetical protein
VYLGLNQETGELMAVKTLPLVGRRGSKELDTQLQELKQVGWGCWAVCVGWVSLCLTCPFSPKRYLYVICECCHQAVGWCEPI